MDKETDEKSYWHCQFKNFCKGCAHTFVDAQNGSPVNVKQDHTHLSAATKVETIHAANQIKEVASAMQEFTHTIVFSAINSVSLAAATALQKLSCIKHTVCRKRQGDAPPLPQSLVELEIPDEYKNALDGVAFLLYDSVRPRSKSHIDVFYAAKSSVT